MGNPEASVRLGAADSSLTRFYHQAIVPALVYIERTNLQTGTVESGTGTVFAVQGNKEDGWLPLICTAAHVVTRVPNAHFRYKVTKYDFVNLLAPTAKSATFGVDGVGPREPSVFYYAGPNSDIVDIGFIRGPRMADDGKPFLEIADDGAPSHKEVAPVETDLATWTSEGSRVAWAGFAALAAEIATRPTPCYFEGSLSALILRKEGPIYLLDGRNTFGVSGGPVWAECAASERPRIIGVISSYRWHNGNPLLPGFAHAVPIQPLWAYMKQTWRAKANLRESSEQ